MGLGDTALRKEKMLTEFKRELAVSLSRLTGHEEGFIEGLFESPKSISHGHVAFPVFFMAREKRMAPPLIAKELAVSLEELGLQPIQSVSPVGGYVNIHIKGSWLQDSLCQKVKSLRGETFGFGQRGRGRKVIIDFSSPNVAKPMSVGHLRATVIGQAMCNLARKVKVMR